MNGKHSFIIALMVILLPLNSALSQDFRVGKRIVRNYSTLNTPGHSQNWCIARDQRGVMYFGGQENGVITFDGHTWERIDIGNNPRILSMGVDDDGVVYVGGASEFGYLSVDQSGATYYNSLINKIDSAEADQMGYVYCILVDGDSIIYSTTKKFFTYYPEMDSVRIIDHSEKYRNVNQIWKVDDRIIAGDNITGLLELKNEELVPMKGGEYFSYTLVGSVVKGKNDGELFVGSYNEGIVLYNYITGEINDEIIDPEINTQLKNYNIYRGLEISENRFAVSTTAYGVYIFNKDGEFIEQINTDNSDLLDNQIYSIYLDENNGSPVLWLTNLENISKVYLGLPYKVVNIEEYYNAGINEFCVFRDDLYLSTDAGVIYSTYNDGDIEFSKLGEFTDQTFSLLNFHYNSHDLLLIGTINGMYNYDGRRLLRIDREEQQGLYVRSLFQSESNPELVYVGLEKGGVRILRFNNGTWSFSGKLSYLDRENGIAISGTVVSITEDQQGDIWFKTDDPADLYRVSITAADTVVTKIEEEHGIIGSTTGMLKVLGDEFIVSTDVGLYSYDFNEKIFRADSSFYSDALPQGTRISQVYTDPDGDFWFSADKPRDFDFYWPNRDANTRPVYKPFYLLPNSTTFDFGYFMDHIWIVKSKQLYIIDKDNISDDYTTFNTLVRKVITTGDSVVFDGSFYSVRNDGERVPSVFQTTVNIPEIDYSHNDLSFFFASTYYLEEDSLKYSYMLEGFDDEWSRWDYVNYRDYTNLPNGEYIFRVRSQNILGIEGNIAEYEFEIGRPWYLSIVALLAYFIMAVLLVYIIIKLYTRRLINENIRLEGIVAERTAEVVKQKEELEASIHYASRIQRAILPTEGSLKGKVDDYFILFKPRDIVSGDFYWISEKGQRVFIVAADCTGHGVPGAFMSILGISFLDEIINKSGLKDTDKIMNELRKHVTESLKQMGENEEETKDGMDMGLLIINYNEDKIEFSGAYNPCWKVRPLTDSEKKKYLNGDLEEKRGEMTNGEYILETIDADRMPIGISSRMDQSFTMHTQKLEKGATYYMFSDGYSDQFGGDSGRKFLKKNMKKLILDIQGVPVKQQKDLLDKRLIDWMGEMEQVDDILVMGIRAST